MPQTSVLHDLIASADVFIQNFRPGVAEKLGAGEDDLRKINPRLIYCAISGFRPVRSVKGPARLSTPWRRPPRLSAAADTPDKPARDRPGDRRRGDRPVRRNSAYSRHCWSGQDGKGRRIDISMLEAMAHFNLDSFTHYYSVGEIMGPLSRPVVSQSYTFECVTGNGSRSTCPHPRSSGRGCWRLLESRSWPKTRALPSGWTGSSIRMT
jgi:hypothetical protein